MTAAPPRRRGDQAEVAAGLAQPGLAQPGLAQPGLAEPGRAQPGLAIDSQPVEWRRRFGWAIAGIWLLYLAPPAATLWGDPDLARRYLGLATLIVFAVLFVATFANSRRLRRQGTQLTGRVRVTVVALAAVLVSLGYLTIGQDASGMFVYVAVMAVFLFPRRAGWVIVAAILAVSLLVPEFVPGWRVDASTTFQIFVASIAMWGVAQVILRNAELAAAHEQIARLVRAEERSRFARDLHDILGHSLTVVAVKAELAGRLTALAPERAEAEIADVERIAREALADVRAAAAGYREVILAAELAGARTALTAAGIAAELPDDLPDRLAGVGAARQEVFGWAVREGVTNVVRHSGATRCTIRVTGSEIEISDDGRGPAAQDPGGSGTAGNAPGRDAPGGGRPRQEATGVPAASAGRAAGRPADALVADGPGARAWAGSCPGTIGGRGTPGGGHGLAGLRERAAAAGGTLSVGRSASGGFELRVRVP